ncbi:synaptobrevin-domain-containing protein [Aspergillus fumigatus]
MPAQHHATRPPTRNPPSDDLRKQVLIRNSGAPSRTASNLPHRDPRVPASEVHPALRTYRQAVTVKPVIDVLDGENKLWDLTEIWYQILKLHCAPEDGFIIKAVSETASPETSETYGLHSMTVTGPGAEGYSTFFAIVCATAVYRDKTSVRLRAASELRRLLAEIYHTRVTNGQYSQLRGAVAVGQSVQFFNWGEDGFLRVFPWATHPFDIKSDHYAVQAKVSRRYGLIVTTFELLALIFNSSCIAHRTTILAEHLSPGTSSTAASSLASIILPKITHDKPQKLTYTHERLFIHYIADSPSGSSDDAGRQEPNSYAPLSYIVVATAEQGRRIPFAFLLEMKRKFLSTYPPSSTDFSSLPAYGCAAFNSELRSLLQTYNTAPPSDSLASARREIDSVRDIMTENIERVLERGERIDLLVDKTDRLGGSAHDFRVRSRGLRRRMWWKNIKLMVLLAVVVVFLIYLFVGMGCGLPAWGKCVGHSA